MNQEVAELSSPVWGCVLIGGKSSRMGTPKHLIRHRECTWIERTVALLRREVSRVVIVGSGELPPSMLDIARLDDISDLAGPLAGILAAFRRYPDVSWLVVACDLPDMQSSALRWLLQFRGAGVMAVMPDLAGDGRVEPLLAYYDAACRNLLEELATSGYRRLSRLQTAPGVIAPQPPFLLRPSWRNVNTPEELLAGKS